MTKTSTCLLLMLTAALGGPVLADPTLRHGDLVTDAQGRTLYTLESDPAGASRCYDDCARTFPPFLSANPNKADDRFKFFDRADGKSQWTYDGRPLYLYHGDSRPGDAHGEMAGGGWRALRLR